MIIPSRRTLLCSTAGALAACIGIFSALHYYRLGLTLSHYDARGHLVVARRVFDSITPGWQQLGAVWLPLPHLLNALPVQIDAFYRTGASGVAISIISFAAATAAVASIVLTLTGSAWAAAAAAAVLALNPNVLYLQATPMTEPLLLALTTGAVAMLLRHTTNIADGADHATDLKVRTTSVGVLFALACLTRYEAWPVTVSALAAAIWVRWRAGEPVALAARRVAAIALYPALAILAFLLFSRIVIGEWFVSSGFFVPENRALGHPSLAASEVVWGVRTLGGYVLTGVAGAGLLWLLMRALFDRRRAGAAIAIALFAAAALPWWAFLQGHPYRIRYMVPLLAAEAVAAGILVGEIQQRVRRLGPAVFIIVACVVAYERPPFDTSAAMVAEAQWDRPNVAARQPVTDCLTARYHGETIMASMGSLGHYMQELSHAGFALRDFLHEGNGDIWLQALNGARAYVGWILIEEQAEGGDMLAQLARENPRFLEGFSRVCQGAGVALYERQNRILTVAR